MQAEWSGLDRYYTAALQVEDSALNSALSANAAAGLPAQDVSPLQGRFLHILARLMRARRVLEIGTLGGYSTIWLARALPADGRVVTLEANPAHADTARANLAAAGVAEKVELCEGPALDSLLLAGGEPFDLIFIDADKPNNPAYLEWALKLARPGAAIVGDNVARGGAVANVVSQDPSVRGVRRFLEDMGAEPRLTATALQTVGVKGWDGFSIAIVNEMA
ncbi:O-methyltransferase [Chromobacterium haemolyticum]|uniref:O-methyltransferase n=1 Tax=Chromobacterium haemolyticum TaxID=394935 RepID=A0ABS3GHQ9_9NEIS|nr:O-methyltransferase [Chromobacterium haemolyticum]MBK0413181.1 O-methyltransferase [Chromobacterium haemolyticum]MBO0414283.1 O-methyltransferase [Chromobacterium haemolyticum]MBO0497858.1 O-methyltransferase [Chromobacterium haemolyticum]